MKFNSKSKKNEEIYSQFRRTRELTGLILRWDFDQSSMDLDFDLGLLEMNENLLGFLVKASTQAALKMPLGLGEYEGGVVFYGIN